MKVNVIFAWPVLTTIFTAFLYWSGYWYFLGFTQFYNYEIDVFDLPFATILIAGLIKNVNHVLILLTILIGISFINSVNKEQWKYALGYTFTICVSIIMFFIYAIKQLLKNKKSFTFITNLKNKTHKAFLNLRPKLRKFARFLILTGVRVQRFQKRNELTELDIRRKSFVSSTPAYSFSTSVFLHYFGMLFLVGCLLCLFKSAYALGQIGKSEAADKFRHFDKMTKVQIKNLDNIDLRNTDICFKGFCLITDKEKNVQIYEMKGVKVINNKSLEKH